MSRTQESHGTRLSSEAHREGGQPRWQAEPDHDTAEVHLGTGLW